MEMSVRSFGSIAFLWGGGGGAFFQSIQHYCNSFLWVMGAIRRGCGAVLDLKLPSVRSFGSIAFYSWPLPRGGGGKTYIANPSLFLQGMRHN